MKTLNESLHALKGELGPVFKDAANPFFKSNYADLNSHLDLVEPLAQKCGLVLTQPCEVIDGCNTVVTTLTHKDTGETIKSRILLPAQPDMQKLGGSISYARRYSLSALLGIRAEDDDGETAVGRGGGKGPAKPVAKSKPVSKADGFSF